MYNLRQRREAAINGTSQQDKETLLKRNALKRNLKVQVAISKLWYTLGTLLIDGLWLNYNTYVSLHTRLSEFMGEDDFDPDELKDAADEDWNDESKKAATRQMEVEMAKCEDETCLGYRDFFESMFMLVDTSMGISDDPDEPPDISEDGYCNFFRQIMQKVFGKTERGWRWHGMEENVLSRWEWEANHELSSWDNWGDFVIEKWVDPMVSGAD